MPDAGAPAIGFVGLGSIGLPMVRSLARAGRAPVVFDLDPGAVAAAVAEGAVAAPSLTDLAAGVDIVAVCVPADGHVRAVFDGPPDGDGPGDGLLGHARPGTLVALHSTVLPDTVRWAGAEARARGLRLVEAPITGGTMAAAEGRSTFLLGGDDADIADLEPLLAACGDVRVRAGGWGSANLLKLCLNLQTYVTFLGVHEAATLARSVGVPLDALKAAMAANGQLGEIVANFLILQELTPADFATPFVSQVVDGHAATIGKDLALIAAVAEGAGTSLVAAPVVRAQLDELLFRTPAPPEASV